MRIATFVGVMLVLAAASAWTGPAIAGTGCLEIQAATTPSEVCAGAKTTVSGSLTNCGDSTEHVLLTGALNEAPLQITATTRPVPGGKSIGFARPVTIPQGTPPGTYTFSVTATTSDGGHATTEVAVTIDSCD